MKKLVGVLVETILVTSVKVALDNWSNKPSNRSPQLNTYYLRKEAHTMAVRAIKESVKDSIVKAYTSKEMNIKELALANNTSPRTIGRILEERGLASPVPRLQGEAYQVMQLLAQYNVSVDLLKIILISHDFKKKNNE